MGGIGMYIVQLLPLSNIILNLFEIMFNNNEHLRFKLMDLDGSTGSLLAPTQYKFIVDYVDSNGVLDNFLYTMKLVVS